MKAQTRLAVRLVGVVLGSHCVAVGLARAGSQNIASLYPDNSFAPDGTAWSVKRVQASDGTEGNDFGHSVAVSGTTALIGAPQSSAYDEQQGAVYVFTKTAGNWNQTQKLLASDGAPNDYFGYAVTILNGTTALIGAPAATVNGVPSIGATYLFTRIGDTWSQTQKFAPTDSFQTLGFGCHIAADGQYAAISASGKVYFFKRPLSSPYWQQTQMVDPADLETSVFIGYSTAVSGTTALIGRPAGTMPVQGAVDVYTNVNGQWSLSDTLQATDGAVDDTFGWAVALQGSNAIVGAPFAYSGYFAQGAVYSFQKIGQSWTQVQEMTVGSTSFLSFGMAVALAPSTIGQNRSFVATTPTFPIGGFTYGAAIVFNSTLGNPWIENQQLSPPVSGNYFGNSVAFDGNTVLVGSHIPAGGIVEPAQGFAHFFTKP